MYGRYTRNITCDLVGVVYWMQTPRVHGRTGIYNPVNVDQRDQRPTTNKRVIQPTKETYKMSPRRKGLIDEVDKTYKGDKFYRHGHKMQKWNDIMHIYMQHLFLMSINNTQWIQSCRWFCVRFARVPNPGVTLSPNEIREDSMRRVERHLYRYWSADDDGGTRKGGKRDSKEFNPNLTYRRHQPFQWADKVALSYYNGRVSAFYGGKKNIAKHLKTNADIDKMFECVCHFLQRTTKEVNEYLKEHNPRDITTDLGVYAPNSFENNEHWKELDDDLMSVFAGIPIEAMGKNMIYQTINSIIRDIHNEITTTQ